MIETFTPIVAAGAGPRRRLPGALASALVAAVAVPPLLQLAHLDVLMLPLLVVGLASVLRAGSGLLDRLVLAAVLLAGGLLTFGVLFSVWPWRIQPLAVGWFLAAAVVAVGALARRRPQLPGSVYLSDLVILGTGIAAFVAAYRPLAHLSVVSRYRYTILTLDRITHFSLFATTQRLGGYPYLHPQAARTSIRNSYEIVYPQGSHFLLAVVNGFISNGRVTAGGTLDFNRYAILVLAVYATLMAAIVWSIRWVAGAAGEPVRLLLCVAGMALALFGPLASLIPFAADSQLFALTFLVVAGAVIVRPVSGAHELLALMGALLVGTFSGYNLYGLMIVLGFVLALLLHRFPVRRHWRAALLILGPAAIVAVIQSVLTVLGSFDVSAQATVAGGHIPLSNWLTVIVCAAPAVPLLLSHAGGTPLWRGYLAVLTTAIVTITGFALYQQVGGHGNSYYLPKMICAGYVLLLPALGLFALMMSQDSAATQRTRRHGDPVGAGLSRAAVASVAVLVAAALTGLGVAQQWLPGSESRGASAHYVPLARWSDGRQKSALAPVYEALAGAGVIDGRTPTIVITSGNQTLNKGVTFAVSGLNNCLGRMNPVLKAMALPARSASGTVLTGQPVSTVLAAARIGGGTMRVVVPNAISSRLRAAATAEAGLHLTILVVAMGLHYVGTIFGSTGVQQTTGRRSQRTDAAAGVACPCAEFESSKLPQVQRSRMSKAPLTR